MSSTNKLLHPDLDQILNILRKKRRFDSEVYIRAKTKLLNSYFRESGIKSCVLGVSGGIDSAVSLALLTEAKKEPGSPIQRIVAALMPMFIEKGTTNQEVATYRGKKVADFFQAESRLVDLSAAHSTMKSIVDSAFSVQGVQRGDVGALLLDDAETSQGDAWASGQLVSYIRTPALFYSTSLLTQQGFPSVLVGTTNRDEGGYIGYFGKAADGMVDVQLISDLHKSEVFKLARDFHIPDEIIQAEPTGDIYDGRTDEQLIGVPYDFIELYTYFLCLRDDDKKKNLLNRLTLDSKSLFEQWSRRLDQLNRQCSHKYLGGSPAVHFDIYEREVPGGWRVETDTEELFHQRRFKPSFVGEFSISDQVIENFDQCSDDFSRSNPRPDFHLESIGDAGHSAFLAKNLLSKRECELLLNEATQQEWVSVGYDGILKNFHPEKDEVGSWRVTSYQEKLASVIWDRLVERFPVVRVMNEDTPTDLNGDFVWRAVGISPLMRFIRYSKNGLLVPHYDSSFQYHSGKRTLMSVVIYLTHENDLDGGATRFILDRQRNVQLTERDLSDWKGPASLSDVLKTVPPQQGNALIFDHRLLHDSQQLYSLNEKIILRTDVVFERCGLKYRKALTVSKALGIPDSLVSETPASIPLHSVLVSERIQKKIALDPYYGKSYQTLQNVQLIKEAGFFDDGIDLALERSHVDRNLQIPTTPFQKVISHLHSAVSESKFRSDSHFPVVLLCTGAFAPLHKGHIQLMEIAKKEMESLGAVVLGGYLSLSHDQYVSTKSKTALLDARHRLRLCEEALSDHNWLMADGWEALENDRAINFTDVIERLEKYLSLHIRCIKPIRVVYVFGSDNAKFTWAFLEKGMSVCVSRPGYETQFLALKNDPKIAHISRIRFASEPCIEGSSTQIRHHLHSGLMPARAFQIYQDWQLQSPQELEPSNGFYFLRDEGFWSLTPWMNEKVKSRNINTFGKAWSEFKENLKKIIQEESLRALAPDRPLHVEFEVIDYQVQCGIAQKLIQTHSVISLDPCIHGQYNLGVSRYFQLGGGSSPFEIGPRPGLRSLKEQIQTIPPGYYVLLDDDIATGRTIKQVQSLLPESVKVLQNVSLLDLYLGVSQSSRSILQSQDILDCRDFLIGARESGLVISLPDGKTARAPYFLPYVFPSNRAKTPISRDLEISYRLWKLNEKFFSQIQTPILLEESSEPFQNLMRYVGFDLKDSLQDICRWHIKNLFNSFEIQSLKLKQDGPVAS